MITQFRFENFKAHRDTELALGPFTVLVGDNGSGKTSVLEGLSLPGKLFAPLDRYQVSLLVSDSELCDLFRRDSDRMRITAQGTTTADLPWTISVELRSHPEGFWLPTLAGSLAGEEFSGDSLLYRNPLEIQARRIPDLLTRLLGHTALYRFRADQIAAAAYSDQPDTAIADDGAQTAVALAALKLAADDAFDRIETALRRLVPSLHRVFLRPATVQHPSNPNPVTGSKLYFDFQGAKTVPAHHASQGTLIALALLTVLHGQDRPRVVLLDDLDHALHPRAQIELVRMIKELLAQGEFKDTQIVATTHSPYVLDEVSPSEVIAFALRDDGSVAAKPLSQHPDAPKVNGSLKAGELWSLDAERDWVL